MKNIAKLDWDEEKTEKLRKKLKRIKTKESIETVFNEGFFRISVGSRTENGHFDDFIEIVIDIFSLNENNELDRLEDVQALLNELMEKGYMITCGENGTISIEISLDSKKIEHELRTLKQMIEGKVRIGRECEE